MRILPNGQVEITNFDTGEVRQVKPEELPSYGISYKAYSDLKGEVDKNAPVPIPTVNAPVPVPTVNAPVPVPTVNAPVPVLGGNVNIPNNTQNNTSNVDLTEFIRDDGQTADSSAQLNNSSGLVGVGNKAIDLLGGVFSAPKRLAKGLAGAYNLSQDQKNFESTQKTDQDIMDRNMKLALQLKAEGNIEGYKRLLAENVKISQRGQQKAQENLDTVNVTAEKGKEDLVKGGVGTAAFFVPGGKTPLPRILTSGLSGGMAGYGSSEKGEELPSIVGGTVTGLAIGTAFEGLKWARDLIKNRSNPIPKDNILQKFGKKVKSGAAPIYEPASVYGAEKEKAINETLDKLGLKGSAGDKYAQLAPKMEELSTKIDDYLAQNSTTVTKKEIIDAFMSKLKSTMRTSGLTDKAAQKEVQAYLKDLQKATRSNNFLQSSEINTKDLFGLKKLINQDAGTIFNKLEKGIPLTPREQVILQGRSAIDEIITAKHPEIKMYTTMQSHLYDAADSLNRARKTVPTQRVFGTTVPADITQKAQDFTGNVIKGTGDVFAGAGNIVNKTISSLPEISTSLPAIKNVATSKTIDYLNNKGQNQQTNIEDTSGNQQSYSDLYTSNDHTTSLPQIKSYITGYSPETWMKEKIKAEAAGNDKAAKAYLENYNAEVANQKLINPPEKVGTPMTQIQVALVKGGSRNLKKIKERYGIYRNGELVDLKLDDMKKSTLTGGVIDPTYKSMAEKIVLAIVRPESGAAIPEDEMTRYIKMFLPMWYDNQESALYKIQDIEARFNDLGIE